MAIRLKMLNSRMTFYRKTKAIISDYGTYDSSSVIVEKNLPVRITMNKEYGNDEVNINAMISASTELIFCQVGVNVKQGDIGYDYETNKKYIVNFVDKNPGGAKISHYQIYASSSDILDIS